MATKVVTGKVRLCWPELFTPKAYEEGEPKFSTMILVPKSDTATVERLRAAEKEAAEDGKSKFPGGKVPPKLVSVIRDGDGENPKTGEKYTDRYPERAGHWFLSPNAQEAYPPGVVDGQLNPIMDRTEIYSGVYARVSLAAFVFNTKGNMGVSFGLRHVQKVADGEPFGGKSNAADDFDALDDDDLI